MNARIEVDLDLPCGPVHAGAVYFSSRRGITFTSFTYAEYLARQDALCTM